VFGPNAVGQLVGRLVVAGIVDGHMGAGRSELGRDDGAEASGGTWSGGAGERDDGRERTGSLRLLGRRGW
jgi:hypothetical protein